MYYLFARAQTSSPFPPSCPSLDHLEIITATVGLLPPSTYHADFPRGGAGAFPFRMDRFSIRVLLGRSPLFLSSFWCNSQIFSSVKLRGKASEDAGPLNRRIPPVPLLRHNSGTTFPFFRSTYNCRSFSHTTYCFTRERPPVNIPPSRP